jgi:hypothetical protein
MGPGDLGWVPDECRGCCSVCNNEFGIITRRHHCRKCGDIICHACCTSIEGTLECTECSELQVDTGENGVRVANESWLFGTVQQKSEVNEGRVCGICFDSIDSSFMDCHDFCFDCMTTYCKMQVAGGQVLDKSLGCPASECRGVVRRGQLKKVLSTAELRAYDSKQQEMSHAMRKAKDDTFLFGLFAASDPITEKPPNTNVVVCTQAGCNGRCRRNLQCKEKAGFGVGARTELRCQDCDTAHCSVCGMEWHLLPSCWLLSQSAQEQLSYEHWSKDKDTRKCPCCGEGLEKSGGCKHMTCFRCKYDFCWDCLCEWSQHRGHGGVCNPLSVLVHDNSRQWGKHLLLRTATKTLSAVSIVVKGAVGVVLVGIGGGCMLILAVGAGGIVLSAVVVSTVLHLACQLVWAVYDNLNSVFAAWRTQSSFRGSAGYSKRGFDPAGLALCRYDRRTRAPAQGDLTPGQRSWAARRDPVIR